MTPQSVNTAASPGLPDLLARCVQGEAQAWRDLHREYYPAAFRFLRRMGVPAADLDDACQEVFVQVFRYLSRFERRADFRTWLYRVCLSQARRSQRRRRVQEVLDWLFRKDPTLAESTLGGAGCPSEVAQRVMVALARMKPMHKTVLVLFDFEGISGDEVARILACPPSTARRRLHYARQEFESLLRTEAAEERKP